MHRVTSQTFGADEDNYMGSLVQVNDRCSTWAEFYADNRIMPCVLQLEKNNSFTEADVRITEKLCKKLGGIFPDEPPALLHGDLWAGNFMCTTNNCAAIYDPAVYYGHREMDIGLSKLFGGFDSRFYASYNTNYPLANGWEERLPLTQLYPVLIHAILFGGHYVAQGREIIKMFG